MKIFIAVHHYPPHFTGGAELRTHRTALALQQRGHTVQTFAIERIDDGPAEGIAWQDEIYEGVPIRRIRFNAVKRPDWFTFSYNNPWIGEHLRQFLGEFQPDIFHLFGGYLQSGSSLWAALHHGIPTVLSLTDYWFFCPQIQLINRDYQICKTPTDPRCCYKCQLEKKRRYLWLGRIFPAVLKFYCQINRKATAAFHQRKEFLLNTINRVDTIIAPSKFIGQVYRDNGVNPAKLVFSRQGRTFENLNPETLQKSPSAVLRLAYLGQLSGIKGVQVILQALRRLPNAPLTLDIFGDLDKDLKNVKRLRQLAGSDARVRFRGVFEKDQVSQVFHEIDAVIVPSLWYENSPNVILEAFAHKTPVLASNLGAMPELVVDEVCGLLFKTGDAASLAKTIQRLLADKDLLPRLAAGIPPLKTEKQEIDELEQIYLNLAAQRAASV